MSDTIEFPINAQMYFKKGMDYSASGESEKAIACLKKSYQLSKNPLVNSYLTVLLYNAGEYEEAYNVASEMESHHVETPAKEMLYVNLLIRNHLFIQAETRINKKLQHPSPEFTAEWVNLEEQLQKEKEKVKKERIENEKHTIRNLYALSEFSIEEQLSIVKQAKILTLKQLQEVAQVIFSNPFVHSLTKTAFLEHLIRFKDRLTYNYPWFGEQKKIIPNQLTLFEKDKIVSDVLNELQNQSEKNPSLYEMLLPEVRHHLMLLHPFIDEVVTSANLWVELYCQYYNPIASVVERDELNVQEKEMYRWIKKLIHLNGA